MAEVKVNNDKAVAKREAAAPMGTFFPPMIPFGRMFGMSPFSLMREFTEEMDRFSRGLAASSTDTMLGKWSPTVDVQQVNGSLVVTAELPGLKKEDVKVELTDDALVIQGERKFEHKEEQEGYRRFERSYGEFYRSIALPEGAKTDQVKAELQDGVLKVSVPVPKPETKARQIPIETKTASAAAKA